MQTIIINIGPLNTLNNMGMYKATSSYDQVLIQQFSLTEGVGRTQGYAWTNSRAKVRTASEVFPIFTTRLYTF